MTDTPLDDQGLNMGWEGGLGDHLMTWLRERAVASRQRRRALEEKRAAEDAGLTAVAQALAAAERGTRAQERFRLTRLFKAHLDRKYRVAEMRRELDEFLELMDARYGSLEDLRW